MKFVDGKILSFDQQIKQKRGPYYEKFIEKQNQLKMVLKELANQLVLNINMMAFVALQGIPNYI
jgi:hypothetical protein